MLVEPKLLGAENPSAFELLNDLFVGNDVAGIRFRKAELNLLDNIQMVKDVLETAVVGKTIEKSADGIFG